MKIALFIFLWLILLSAGFAGISAAPWVPTKSKHKKYLLKNISFKDGETIYDLGCGTGTIVFAIAKMNSKVKLIGLEISILPYLVAKMRSLWYPNVTIKFANLFKYPLGDADSIFIFLLAKSYPKLQKKLSKEIKDDCRIILEGWPFEKIEADRVIKTDGAMPTYLYTGRNLRV